MVALGHDVYAGHARELCRALAKAGYAGRVTIEAASYLRVEGGRAPEAYFTPLLRVIADADLGPAVRERIRRGGWPAYHAFPPRSFVPPASDGVPLSEAFNPPDVAAVCAEAWAAGGPADSTVTTDWSISCTPVSLIEVIGVSDHRPGVGWVDGPPSRPVKQRLPDGWVVSRTLSLHAQAQLLLCPQEVVCLEQRFAWGESAVEIPQLDEYWSPVADLLGILADDQSQPPWRVLDDVGLAGLVAVVHG